MTRPSIDEMLAYLEGRTIPISALLYPEKLRLEAVRLGVPYEHWRDRPLRTKPGIVADVEQNETNNNDWGCWEKPEY